MSNRAWVTLATNDSYGLGALVLANSLRRVNSAFPAVVLITPSVTEPMRDRLRAAFAEVVTVDVLDSRDAAHLALLQRPELGITFTKIHCWNLTQYEKCVFLDADTLVVQNCDELFEREQLSAAPDVGWPDCFNSGVFVFTPSADTFSQLITFAQERGSFDGGDQGLLNSFFSDWARGDINKHLPFLYNVTSAAFYSYLPALKHYGQNLKIIHFIGAAKPWLQQYNFESSTVDAPEHIRGFLQLWWDIFVSLVHPQLDTAMSGVAGNLARVLPGAPGQREALDELTRRQGWEAGNIDYMGADSFDNIWAKISQTLNRPRSSPPKQSPPKEVAPPQQVEVQTGEVAKEPVSEQVEVAKEAAPVEALCTKSSQILEVAEAPVQVDAAAPVAAAESVEVNSSVENPSVKGDTAIEASVLVETAAPVVAAAQVEAAAPVDADQPNEAVTPVEAAAQIETAAPVKTVASVEVTAPVEPAVSVEPVTPVEVIVPAETAAPVKAAAPAEAAVQVESATPVEAAAPVKVTAPVESIAPVEATTTAQAAAPVEATAPVDPAAPVAPAVPVEPAVTVESNPQAEAVALKETSPVTEVPVSVESVDIEVQSVDDPTKVPTPEVAVKVADSSEQKTETPIESESAKDAEATPVSEPVVEAAPTPAADATALQATPEKQTIEAANVSTDSPPLANTPTKEGAAVVPAAKSEERRKPAGKLKLAPPAAADPLPTPDSELEDAATLAQSIIASELRTPTVTSPEPAAPLSQPSAPTPQLKQALSVEEPEVPTPPVGAVSLAQIGVKSPSKGKSTTAAQIESSVVETLPSGVLDLPPASAEMIPVTVEAISSPAEATSPAVAAEASAAPVSVEAKSSKVAKEPAVPSADVPKKKVVKKVVKKEASATGADAPVPPPRKKEKKPKEK